MKRGVSYAFACLLLSCSSLGAVEISTESYGSSTRRWLELQRSGAVASSTRQPLSGPVAKNIHERYVDSFTYPIPEYYYDEESGSNSSSSSQ